MPLAEVDITLSRDPVPADIEALIQEAADRADRLVGARLDHPLPGFVPCDHPLAYRTLRSIRDLRLAPGNAFCEWGSAMGVVTMLAASLGYDACGIEIEGDLVTAGQRMAKDFGADVELVEGSMLPDDFELDFSLAGSDGVTWMRTDGSSGHTLLDREPEDFDVIFVYPWPAEEEIVCDLFERVAADGTLLMSFRGAGELRLQRKVARRRRRIRR